MTNQQPKSLELADSCRDLTNLLMVIPGLDTVECEAELRRLHAENERQREVMRQALEALEALHSPVYGTSKTVLAINALREALANGHEQLEGKK